MTLTAKTLTIHWHDKSLPVYSVDFEPSKQNPRLATGGGDGLVRLWRLVYDEDHTKVESVEYLSTLSKHVQAVNCVRFSPSGKLIASASDDGSVIVWQKAEKATMEFGQEDEDAKESWAMKTMCTCSPSGEVYDLCWSPDSKYVCCGSMNNLVRVFDVATGALIQQLAQHTHYVQGVAWDPLNEFICSESADRSVQVFRLGKEKISPVSRIQKMDKSGGMLFHNETLQSFFRRLSFSPDGSMLITASGIYKDTSGTTNTVYIHTRAGLGQSPLVHLPGFTKPAIAIRFSPVFYEPISDEPALFALPYRMVFAVATQDSVVIFDTQRLQPLGIASNIHYAVITDVCWSPDGHTVMVSSADGFCSSIIVDQALLGEELKDKGVLKRVEKPVEAVHTITGEVQIVKENILIPHHKKDKEEHILIPRRKKKQVQPTLAQFSNRIEID